MLQEFEAAWDQVRRIDRVILDLAVQNTNLKAFRLSFGKGRETVEHFENALNAVAADREFRAVTATVAEREAIDESTAQDYPTLIELAKKCIAEYRFEAAGAQVRKAVAIDPSRPEAFNLLGAIQEILGAHPSEALKNYHAALSLDSSYAPARKNIERIAGENKYRRGKIDIDPH